MNKADLLNVDNSRREGEGKRRNSVNKKSNVVVVVFFLLKSISPRLIEVGKKRGSSLNLGEGWDTSSRRLAVPLYRREATCDQGLNWALANPAGARTSHRMRRPLRSFRSFSSSSKTFK